MNDKICDYHDDSNVGRGSCNPKTCSEYKVNGVYQNKATPTPRVGVIVHQKCISCGKEMELLVEESRTTDYCPQCSDTPDGRSEMAENIMDFVEPKEYLTEDSKIRAIDLFFERFPMYSTAVSYQEETDSFIGSSGTTPIQLIDIWNSRYQIFNAGMKSRQQEIDSIKNRYNINLQKISDGCTRRQDKINKLKKQIEELQEALDGAHLQITKLRENLTIDKKVK